MNDNDQLSDRTRDLRGSTPNNEPAALEPWVVSLLACPVDRGRISLEGRELVCDRCGRRYPVENGVPNMLPEQAKSEQ